MEINTLAAFRASSTKWHVNITQGRNHGRNPLYRFSLPAAICLGSQIGGSNPRRFWTKIFNHPEFEAQK